MTAVTQAPVRSNKVRWAGYTISGLAVLFLIFDTVIKVLQLAPAVDSTVALGYPAAAVLPIGLVELACLAVYLVPRTAPLGALLLTGYLGGAIATHVFNSSPTFSLIFPLIIGAMLWGGLWLLDRRVRGLLKPRG